MEIVLPDASNFNPHVTTAPTPKRPAAIELVPATYLSHSIQLSMSTIMKLAGPLGGQSHPVNGGAPNLLGCNGCVDCCHLAEISVTDNEAELLHTLFAEAAEPAGTLRLTPDDDHPGWQIMLGPCVFRKEQRALREGGCTIYENRPASCRIFTCQFLLDLRRSTANL
ncbi:MAG: hypothetical protein NVSMB52_01550 [Chloroflexota bacterium]